MFCQQHSGKVKDSILFFRRERSPLSPLFLLTGLLRAGNLGKVFKRRGWRGQQRAVCGPEELSEKLGEFWKEKTANEAKSRKYA